VRDARPPHVEYVLTGEGRRLKDLLDALTAWAAR
jgi:DNA-binding HxlR family transcriptional regulator